MRHEANILAIVLVGDRKAEFAGQPPRALLGQSAQRKAQEIEFGAGRAIEEIALVAREVAGTVQFRPVRPFHAADVMTRCQCGGAEIARRRQKVAELDALIAAYARDRRLAAPIAVGKILDHRRAKPGFVIEHVMGNAEARGDIGGIADILAGAARALTPGRRAVVIELQRDADDIEPGARQQRRDDRQIDAP